MKDLYVAVVCLSNINRSVETQAYLARKGVGIKSFGTGDIVRLPGESPDSPNCYEFGTPYQFIYDDLVKKNWAYYTQSGLLNIIDRNRRVKQCPERLQDSNEMFDVIITCGENIFHQVVQMFANRPAVINKKVHILNLDVADNPEEATIGSFMIAEMVILMMDCKHLDSQIEHLINVCELKYERSILNCIMSY